VYERLTLSDVRPRVSADRVDRLALFAVAKGNVLQQQLDLFRAVDAAPGVLGFLDQLQC
jgi:hypothetical protein